MIKWQIKGGENFERVRNHLKTSYRPAIFDALTKAIQASQFDLVNHIKTSKLSGQVLRRRTGRLSKSIFASPVTIENGELVGRVGTNVEYAIVHELGGTKEYEIRAKSGKALRFLNPGGFTFSAKTGKVSADKGNYIYRRSVMHPPAKARPFMQPSLEEKRPSILERINKACSEACVTIERNL